MDSNEHINTLQTEIEELKQSLYEAQSIIDAIREGSVDALVFNKNGEPHVYSIESADYTYRILIEKFGEGALSISHDGLILYCNDAFSKLLRIPANQIVGTFLKSYVESQDELEILLSDAINGRPSKGELLLLSDNKLVPVYMSLTDLHPHVAAIGVVVTDLSEKREYEYALLKHQLELEMKVKELHRTNTDLEEFIHVISHDLKEPVRKLATYTEQMAVDPSGLTERQSKNLRIVNNAAFRLNSLVDDLVKYAFVANQIENAEVSLDDVLDDVIEDLELLITERNAVIQRSPLPVIRGSKIQMRQVFSNLITNAIKYAKADVAPEIGFSAELGLKKGPKSARFHKVFISDNGIGMEKTHLKKIFTIFQRLHARDQYSGNGIGLAICKKVMENHNGKIDVESSIKGTTFILQFPNES